MGLSKNAYTQNKNKFTSVLVVMILAEKKNRFAPARRFYTVTPLISWALLKQLPDNDKRRLRTTNQCVIRYYKT